MPTGDLAIYFPDARGQRLVTRYMLPVPDVSALSTAPADSGDGREYRLVVEGIVEEGGEVFDQFRVRFVLPERGGEGAAADEDDEEAGTAEKGSLLVWDELLRPDQDYVVRLKVRDEVGGAEAYVAQGFRVPSSARPGDLPRPSPSGSSRP